MKKALKIFVLILAIAFIAIQFIRIDRTAPPIVASETLQAVVSVPPDVSLILARSCNDCHTNNTVYPWYTNIQPGAWFMKDHIDNGRGHLNFSVFATYTPKKQVKKLEEICDEVEAGSMPLPSYLWIHGDAVLSQSDSQALCDWVDQEKVKIVVPVS